MKKFFVLTLVLLLVLGCACAEISREDAKQSALNMLTEVYGYTAEETAVFQMDVVEENGQYSVECWPENHPEWLYRFHFDLQTGSLDNVFVPFKGGREFYGYPGEATVRDGLRTARAEGWFAAWDEKAQQAMLAWFAQQTMLTPSADLQSGLALGNLSAAQALHGFFVSCYGEPAGWTKQLKAWHDEELASYGLALDVQSRPQQGVIRYEIASEKRTFHVVQFSGEVPSELAAVLTHPKLEGWKALCGAYYDAEARNEWDSESGLIALEKEGQRLLVQLGRMAGKDEWALYPVGYRALKQKQDLYITCEPISGHFRIVYPLTASEDETFEVACRSDEAEAGCSLICYSRQDRTTGAGLYADFAYQFINVLEIDAAGEKRSISLEKMMHNAMQLVDADSFPSTLTAWSDLPAAEPPKGYGVSSGVHLRAQTSTRSKDLGDYHSGVLVEILGEEDGDPYNWYHVRAGGMEGYMLSVYVDYEGSPCSMNPLMDHEPLPVAETTKAVKLRSGTGLFAKTVRELPAGTRMHVMAERGRWLHVMIPEGDIGWMMDVNGTSGYVPASDVRTASFALDLDWAE